MNLLPRVDAGENYWMLLAAALNLLFVLLLFLLAGYALNSEEKFFGVNLPASEIGTPLFSRQQQVVINLTAQGEIYVENRLFTAQSLERRLAQLSAFISKDYPLTAVIRADGNCPHREIVNLLALCARAGIHNLQIMALAEN